MKQNMSRLALGVGCLLLAACRGEEQVGPMVDNCFSIVTVVPASLSLPAGASAGVRALVNRGCPLVTLDTLSWRSSDASIATVQGVGRDSAVVRGVSRGRASIIAAGAPGTDAASGALLVTVP